MGEAQQGGTRWQPGCEPRILHELLLRRARNVNVLVDTPCETFSAPQVYRCALCYRFGISRE